MNGRIYDPTLGRFLQADPFIQAPSNTQSFNRYAYVWNNPLRYTDPSGYFTASIRRGLIKAATKVFGKKFTNWVGTTVASIYGNAWEAAAWTYEYNRAMGVPASGALRAAAVAGVNSYMNGPQEFNWSSAVTAAGVIDSKTAKYLNFAVNGFDPSNWSETRQNFYYEIRTAVAQKQMSRMAESLGMSHAELNALLQLNSIVGRELAGSRLVDNEDGTANIMGFFTTREHGGIGGIWDVNDYLLGTQGLIDAIGQEYIQGVDKGLFTSISSCHSLGSITCNNLVARGHASSAELNSLPMGHIGVGGNMRSTYNGSGDPINWGVIGNWLNPYTQAVDQSNKSCGIFGFGCHGYKENYVRSTGG